MQQDQQCHNQPRCEATAEQSMVQMTEARLRRA